MANSYSNFFNNGNTFGVNVKRTETTTTTQKQAESQVQQQVKQQEKPEVLNNLLKPVEKLVGSVMDVFNGNVASEVNKYRVMAFNTELIMHETDVKVNGQKPTFDMKF